MSSQLAQNILQTAGSTPLVKLNRIAEGLDAEIYLKCEFFNPLFSVKDRIGISMIESAEKEGKLKPGSTVIEPTSGNTGIALAFVCASKGYKCILTMPETMSIERRILPRLFGAEIVLTPGEHGMPGAITRAGEILQEHASGAFMPQQFENPANPEVHRRATAEEIWSATRGQIDVFVAGVGTGGTITGVAEVIKSRRKLHVAAVEPADSPVLSGGRPGPHKIQGIGAGFIPKVLNTEIIDEVITATSDNTFETARKLPLTDGIPAGISTGAAVWAALQIAARPGMAGKRVVVIGPSPSERYLSTPLADRIRAEAAALKP